MIRPRCSPSLRALGPALVLGGALALVPGPATIRADEPAGGPPGVGTTVNPALEALQRLKGMDLEANAALKSAVLRVLETTRGTAQFVEIVRDFHLTGHDAGLLEVAARMPGESAGTDAIRCLLKTGGAPALASVLTNASLPETHRLATAQALANAADPAGVPLLAGLLEVAKAPATLQAAAVHGLARTERGARRLLDLARDGRLEDAARTTAALDLAQSRWPEIRAEGARVVPLPKAADGGELPALPDLVRLVGDAGRGARVFRSEQAACIKCHRVADEGVDFGPALSGIGAKLAREAIFESILDPSAGISFGYEAWSIETKSGEEVFGILASETADELVIRQQSGVSVRLGKADVAGRERQRLSVMPAGLAQLLTRQELVDVVEYLVSLKAGTPAH